MYFDFETFNLNPIMQFVFSKDYQSFPRFCSLFQILEEEGIFEVILKPENIHFHHLLKILFVIFSHMKHKSIYVKNQRLLLMNIT